MCVYLCVCLCVCVCVCVWLRWWWWYVCVSLHQVEQGHGEADDKHVQQRPFAEHVQPEAVVGV